ncbi:hypothetical protein V7266_05340 [Neobacillus drentensis]|uniref:DUF6954 family protein n=1 Tax=Neobacillus drentensis TaxID=220684 RepID=UPI0030004B6A
MKIFLHSFFIIFLALVTFFGVGPILLADGSVQERLWTAAIVIVLYLIIGISYRITLIKSNKR